MLIETRAFARAGLVGNPSDGYFGKTISISIRNFGASIILWSSPELVIEPQQQDQTRYRNITHLYDEIMLTGYHGGIPLIKATIKKFVEKCNELGVRLPNKNFSIRYSSSIPRQVGLAGSSAIVVACLKALMQFYEVQIPLHILPSLALSVETDELKITAGLQDRVIQTYEGCVYMDFEKEYLVAHQHGQYEKLLLPTDTKFYLAYKTQLGKVSGTVLNTIRAKFEAGDKDTIATLAKIANLAEQAKSAIEAGEVELLNALINQNFDYRKQIMPISPSNLEMIECARRCGASASFTGSGGAIIGIYPNEKTLVHMHSELKKINAKVIKPILV